MVDNSDSDWAIGSLVIFGSGGLACFFLADVIKKDDDGLFNLPLLGRILIPVGVFCCVVLLTCGPRKGPR
jgi:hypothetical protein